MTELHLTSLQGFVGCLMNILMGN